MTRLVALIVGGEISPWQSLGFDTDHESFRIADVSVRVTGGPQGLVGWHFSSDHDGDVDIDGIPTELVTAAPASGSTSRLGVAHVVGLDHVVVNTDDATRTCTAIERELGLPVRRVRELGKGVTQTFHKADNTVIEVVSGPHIEHRGARLWGMVASLDHIEAFVADAVDRLGETVVTTPKAAVQPGRLISTVRADAGLGVPFALMSPHVPTPRAD